MPGQNLGVTGTVDREADDVVLRSTQVLKKTRHPLQVVITESGNIARANLATSAEAKSKPVDQCDESTGFRYAPARQSDGAARSHPATTRAGPGFASDDRGSLRLAALPSTQAIARHSKSPMNSHELSFGEAQPDGAFVSAS